MNSIGSSLHLLRRFQWRQGCETIGRSDWTSGGGSGKATGVKSVHGPSSNCDRDLSPTQSIDQAHKRTRTQHFRSTGVRELLTPSRAHSLPGCATNTRAQRSAQVSRTSVGCTPALGRDPNQLPKLFVVVVVVAATGCGARIQWAPNHISRMDLLLFKRLQAEKATTEATIRWQSRVKERINLRQSCVHARQPIVCSLGALAFNRFGLLPICLNLKSLQLQLAGRALARRLYLSIALSRR